MLRLWKWTSVSIRGPLLGNKEGRSFPRAFERKDKFLHLRNFYKEFEICVKKALYTGSSPHRGSVGETGGVRLLGLLREKENAYVFLFLGPRGH
jgi:hypothetical protein